MCAKHLANSGNLNRSAALVQLHVSAAYEKQLVRTPRAVAARSGQAEFSWEHTAGGEACGVLTQRSLQPDDAGGLGSRMGLRALCAGRALARRPCGSDPAAQLPSAKQSHGFEHAYKRLAALQQQQP